MVLKELKMLWKTKIGLANLVSSFSTMKCIEYTLTFSLLIQYEYCMNSYETQ